MFIIYCRQYNYYKGGTAERDRRLELIKLLPVLRYCVSGCFNCSVFQH